MTDAIFTGCVLLAGYCLGGQHGLGIAAIVVAFATVFLF